MRLLLYIAISKSSHSQSPNLPPQASEPGSEGLNLVFGMEERRVHILLIILVVKLRLTTGETAALRAAAMAERWRNMADVSIGGAKGGTICR